jgi:hypothetical protein
VSFELSLSFSLLFSLGLPLSCQILAFAGFLLLDGLFEFFFGFWSFSCASIGIGFEIQTLCFCVVNVLIKGEIEKSSGQYLGLSVMSN